MSASVMESRHGGAVSWNATSSTSLIPADGDAYEIRANGVQRFRRWAALGIMKEANVLIEVRGLDERATTCAGIEDKFGRRTVRLHFQRGFLRNASIRTADLYGKEKRCARRTGGLEQKIAAAQRDAGADGNRRVDGDQFRRAASNGKLCQGELSG